jgi:hypothetical protein
MNRNMLHLLTSGIMALLSSCFIQSADAAIYNFDQLSTGPINGQDNWAAGPTGGPVVETGAGINSSNAFSNSLDGLPEAAAARTNDNSFSYPALGPSLRFTMGFDFRVDNTAAGLYSSAKFMLAEHDDGFGTQDMIGFGYSSSFNQMLIYFASDEGGGYGGAANNFNHVKGNWYRFEMRVDPTAYGGNGSGSLFYKNLTAGDTNWTAVPILQNIGLRIADQEVDLAQYDRMGVWSSNTQVDNLLVVSPDYNLDGTVDAADYIVWRKTDGTQQGFDIWRANFGTAAGIGHHIPEPSGWHLIGLACFVLALRTPNFLNSKQRRPLKY